MTENSAALRSYTYDSGGSILTDTRPGEVFGFAYNARNRPASVTRNSVAYASYSYNAFEQLAARSTSAPGGPSGTVHCIHDLSGHIIAEADASTGAITRDYIWMAANDNEPTDLPLAVAEGSSLYMVHTDHLGRPVKMTDATKSTVWAASYNPRGEATSLSGTTSLNLRFPGQVFQIETGLAYNWHRHYDTTTGRYTQPDPLGFVDGPSIYAYAGNSPFMYVDREGRWINFAIGAAIGIGIEFLTNGKCATLGDYALATAGGAIGGGIGGKGLVSGLRVLGNRAKGNIGEGLAIAKNLAKGRILYRVNRQIPNQRARYDAIYKTITGRTIYGEAKFGTSGLTAAQRAAQCALGDSYVVDKFSYEFFSKTGAGLGGALGGGAAAAGGYCGCE